MTGYLTIWTICLTHKPVHADLYRSVNDFTTARWAETLSFDDGRRDRTTLSMVDVVVRIVYGRGWLARGCHRMPVAAAQAA